MMKYRNPKLKKRIALQRKMESYKKRLKPPTDNAASRSPNPLLLDPTRTQTLRRSFGSKVKGVFAQLGKRIAEYLIGEDPLGLTDQEDQLAIINAFCSTGAGGGVDPTCGKGAGSAAKPSGDLHPKTKKILQAAGTLAAAGGQVSAKAVKVGKAALKKGLAYMYREHGNIGSICTFLVAQAIFTTASGMTGGGAGVAGAILFGLASAEVRKKMVRFMHWAGSDESKWERAHPVEEGMTFHEAAKASQEQKKPIDPKALAADVFSFLQDFAKAGGLPELKITSEEIEEMVGRVLEELPVDPKAVSNVFCPTGEGGGVDPTCKSGEDNAKAQQWTNPNHKTAAQLHGLKGIPIAKFKAYHVLPRASLESLLSSGFDPTRFKPRWKNDYAVSLSRGSIKQAIKFFTQGGGKFNLAKYAVVEVTVEGNHRPENEYLPTSLDFDTAGKTAEQYTQEVVKRGVDSWGGKSIYVYNPRAIKSIKEVRPTLNVYCPTGEGGGVDPSCPLNQTLLKELEKIVHDPKTKAADRRNAMVKLSKLRDQLEASGATQPKAERDEGKETPTVSSVEAKARDLASKANYGYVRVAELWKALGSPPLPQFHTALQHLWKKGVLRLQEHEGRHGISDEEQSTALQVTGYHSDRPTRFTGFTVNLFVPTSNYDPNEPRDEIGRWVREGRAARREARASRKEARAEAVADMSGGGIKGFFKRLFGGGKKAEKGIPQPTNPPEDYLDRGALGRMVRVKDKFDEVSNKVPGVQKTKAAVSTLFKGIHGRLEHRYGSKVANTIMISGPLGGYGVMAGAIALTGTPGIPVVNDLVSIAAQTAVAELGLQSGRLYKRFPVGHPAVANEETQLDLHALAQQVAEEIREGLASIAEEYREELEEALSLSEVKRLVDEAHMDSVRNSSPDPDQDELVENATFGTSAERLSSFQSWLEGQLQHLVLSQQQRDLWNRYIQEGFEKGAGRSYEDVTGRRYDAPTDPGSTEEFLRTSFANPQRRERLELVASRTFDEVKNLTEDMKNRLARVLANALVAGQSPREAAKNLATELNISRERALLIAQTELIRAHAEGQLTALEALGVPEVGVLVEWTPKKNLDGTIADTVCPRCRKMAGVVLKLSEARGLIPLHPRCMCTWIPAGLGESRRGQKTTKREIERAAEAADVEVEVGIRPRMRRPVQNTYRFDTLTVEDVKELLAGNSRFFFADCNRDSHGYCLPDWTVLVKDEKEETKELSFKFSGVKAVKRARTIALERANSNPKPTPEEVKQANRKMDEKGAADYESDIRGNSVSRKASRQRLLKDFGNGTHCPCIYCGAQLDETTVTRDKILTARQGGRYRNENLVPACLACNKSRGDLPFNDIKWSKLKDRPVTTR